MDYCRKMKTLKPKYQFIIDPKDVKNALKGVIKFASENPQLQNRLFAEEIPLFLQINSFKIPGVNGTAKQLFRIPLANSPLSPDADICLIVPDVKGMSMKEPEKHIQHYETLLKSKNVTGIKEILPFYQFKTQYDTFELKNRLADLYDFFLVDGRISGKVVHKCGSIFYKKRKVPVAVKLHLPNLKGHIEQSLRKAFFHINLKSDSHSVEIGYSKMKILDLLKNVYSVIEFIDKHFPGKIENIRSLYVYAHRGTSIPIYMSLSNPNDVGVPVLSSQKPKAFKTFRGELTTQYDTDVIVKPSGRVIVKKSKGHENKNENTGDVRKISSVEKKKKRKIYKRIKRATASPIVKKSSIVKKKKVVQSQQMAVKKVSRKSESSKIGSTKKVKKNIVQ